MGPYNAKIRISIWVLQRPQKKCFVEVSILPTVYKSSTHPSTILFKWAPAEKLWQDGHIRIYQKKAEIQTNLRTPCSCLYANFLNGSKKSLKANFKKLKTCFFIMLGTTIFSVYKFDTLGGTTVGKIDTSWNSMK